MAPWLSAALVSPVVLIALLVVVGTSMVVLRAASARTFRGIGFVRIVGGYFGAVVALVPFGLVMGGFSLGRSFEAWFGLSYLAWLTLAVLIVPAAFILFAHNRCSAVAVIVIGFLSSLPIQGVLYSLSGPMGRETLSGTRLAGDLAWFAVFFAVVGFGFAMGARLPWKGRIGPLNKLQ
jgi:hypothetical protein